MISREQFYKRLNNLPAVIPSKTGKASYSEFRVINSTLHFKRNETGEYWDLDIDVLYSVYLRNDFINTTVVKEITGGRVNSPSVAILMAIGCLEQDGKRITN
ncbi:MAG: hypothetical protein ABJB11_16945 [Ferruginibacter sp.]